MEKADVIVVGAGPAGLLVAGDLAEAGIDVVVLDRRAPGQSNLTRAFVVGPRTLEQFDARGMADHLVATGSRLTSMRLYRRLWIDFATMPTRFPYQLITPQYETEAVLRARAAHAGVRFEWRTEVTGVTQDDSAVVATAGNRSWRARYLVGADGSHSAVRHAVGEPFPGKVAVRSMMLADVRFGEHPDAVLRADANRHGFAFHVPFGDGWYRVIAWNRADDRPAGAPLDLDDLRFMLRSVYGTDYGVHDARWLSRFRADERQVARYRIGRVFLAGDAAHVHTPAGAQGMNTGLQDAANLGWRLVAAVRGHTDVLDGYQRERHPVARRVIRGSGALMRVAKTGCRPLRAVRLAGLGGLSGRWPVPRPIAEAVAGIGIRYPAPAGAHPAVGRRVPDLRLADGERLYTALRGGRFVLVRGGHGAARHPWPGPVTEVRAAAPPRADLPGPSGRSPRLGRLAERLWGLSVPALYDSRMMRRILVASLALVAAVGTACSSDEPAGNLPDGAALLEDSAAATSDITSAHFSLVVNGEVPGLDVKNAEGDLTREGGPSGAAKGTVSMNLFGQLFEGEFVIVDDVAYIKGPTGDYTELSASMVSSLYDPAAILDPERGVAHVLGNIQDPKTEALEEVDGVSAYRIKGRVTKDVVADLVPGIDSDVDITVWVAQDGEHLPVKASVAVPAEGDPTVDVTLSNIDEPVEITAPN